MLGETILSFSFLACLYKCTEELLHYLQHQHYAAVASAWRKFYVMSKGLSGELSCLRTGLVASLLSGFMPEKCNCQVLFLNSLTVVKGC